MVQPSGTLFARQRRQQRDREPTGHAVRVAAERRQPPDVDRFAAALLALALAELEDERRAAAGEGPPVEQSSGR
jgi:hypothetical protein